MRRLIFLFLVVSIVAGAQNATHWKINLSNKVEWFSVAPNGMLITAQAVSNDSTTTTRLSGIDPATGVVAWTFQPARRDIVISGIDLLPGTNKLQPRNMPLTLLDPADGRVLFDAQNTYGNGASKFGLIENTSTLWVESADSARVFYLFDFEKQKLLWLNTSIYEGAGVANKISVGTKSFTSKKVTAAALLCAPLIWENDMIVVTQQGIFKISMETGLLIWQAPLPDPQQLNLKIDLNQGTYRLFKGDKHFFLVRNQYLMAFNYADGKSAWINFAKTSGPVEKIYFDAKGMVLLPGLSEMKGEFGESRITMVSEMTGENLWPQDPSFNGTVTHYASTAKGLAVVMKNSIDVNKVDMIDLMTGKFLWPSSVKLSGQVQKLDAVPKGLLYQTVHDVNILGFDGYPLLDIPSQSALKKPVVIKDDDEKFYFFSSSNNNLYEIDKRAATSRVVNREPVKFKSENPEHIEPVAEGILLYAKQNIMVLTPDGGVKFLVYKPSASNLFAQLKKDVTQTISKNSKEEIAATASTNPLEPADYLYIQTKNDQSVVLLVFDKHTGRQIASADFLAGDDQPTYLIDKERGILFYTPKGKDDYGNPTHIGEIQCWKF